YDSRRRGAGGLERRSQTEHQTSENCQGRGEAKHTPVRAERDKQTARFPAEVVNQQLTEHARQSHSKESAGEGEQQAFCKELANQAAALRAQSKPDGDFALARAGTRQHQVGQIGAGNHQHQSRNGQQQPQGHLIVAAKPGKPVGYRKWRELHSEITLGAVRRIHGRKSRLHDRRRNACQLSRSFFKRPSRLEAPQNGQPPAMGHRVKVFRRVDDRLRTNKDRHTKFAAYLQAIKAGRGHADHWEGMAIQAYSSSDDIGITAELSLPEAVADHGAGRAAASVIVRRVKKASENRLNAENVKKFSAHPEPVNIAGLAAVGKIEAGGAESKRIKSLRLSPHLLPNAIRFVRVTARHVSGTAWICGT